MATRITPDGESTQVFPADGKAFTLEELYRHVGCKCVEKVNLADGRFMWMDEDGKATNKPINELASNLLYLSGGIGGDYVVGTVLLTTPAEGG